jgi:REP element-mobilizing transposase RayT
MPQSLSAVHVHFVFSTKERRAFLQDRALRAELHAYLGGIARKLNCPPDIVGGTEDHVHLLCRLGRAVSQADLVKEAKRVSSAWIKDRSPGLDSFAWQGGYGAFSVSGADTEGAQNYIARQEEHHRRLSFQEEFREFLRRCHIDWDERYVWD